MSDRVAVMDHGLLEQVGRPEDVYRRPMTPFVASFVGLANQLAGRIAGPAPGGSYEVDLDHLGRRLAHGPPGLAAGTPVSVVVRPEDLRLTPAADTQAGPAAATVVDVAFLGAHRTVRLDAGALGQLVAIGQGQSAIAPDDKVVLSWTDDDAWAVPAAADDEAAEGEAAEGEAAEGELR